MKNNSFKIVILAICLLLVLPVMSFAKQKAVYVSYNSSENLVYSSNKVYQQAFYDYGTIIPYDNARLTAISSGNSGKNYASIKYLDYNGKGIIDSKKRNFTVIKDRGSSENKYAKADRISPNDYYYPGSYAYSEGYKILDLGVKW